jgi:phosphoribosylformimino-5-aminoimidazole carboxamide ribotide isomerase
MTLTLYPAIDLKGGKVVRLKRGEMDQATIYAEDPGTQAATFVAQGFSWIHVVDLDGAFAGKPANADAVRAILAAAPGTRVQLGGGIRSMAVAESWLAAGVARIILGSAAVKDPGLARDGMVATEGWAETSDVSATDLARRFEDSGAAAVIYTDIARDGMLGGVNVEATAALARAAALPVIASGGVAGLVDIVALRAAGAGIEGAIIGRALYDGRIDPGAALSAAA